MLSGAVLERVAGFGLGTCFGLATLAAFGGRTVTGTAGAIGATAAWGGGEAACRGATRRGGLGIVGA